MVLGAVLCTKENTLFYAECKLGDLNANWIPILSVSIFASYNFTPSAFVPIQLRYIQFSLLVFSYVTAVFCVFMALKC